MNTIQSDRLSCGSCTMCCKLLSIEEIKKPAGVWCGTCDPKSGCKDYENRPQSCKDFECLWLHSQKPHISEKLRFPPEMRPDKCKVILHKKPSGEMVVHVSQDHPDAFKKGAIGEWLKRENKVRPVTIISGESRFPMKEGN